jgi:hypothetical protein
MIARIWRGVVRLDDADAYAGYIRGTGFAEYAETSGNRGAWILRRGTRGTGASSSPLRDQPAVAVQDRGGMMVAVGVDPDDVVDLAF